MVTAVCFVATAWLAACDVFQAHQSKQTPPEISSVSQAVYRELENGNASLDRAQWIERDLAARYVLSLESSSSPERISGRGPIPLARNEGGWRQLTRREREDVKAQLSTYIALASDVLSLDAKRGIYVTHREQVISKRDSAIGYLRSLERFERQVGEGFEPAKGG